MWSDRVRSRTEQPELPLDEISARPSASAPSEWRLDERTRRLGRAGVAAARARLTPPTGDHQMPTPASPSAGAQPQRTVAAAAAQDRAA